MLVLRVIPCNILTLVPSAFFEAVVIVRRIGGSCGSCREVKEHCDIVRGDCKCGVAAMREGMLVMAVSVVKREMFVTVAFVVKT